MDFSTRAQIAGQLEPTSGRVLYNGKTEAQLRADSVFLKKLVAYVDQVQFASQGTSSHAYVPVLDRWIVTCLC